MHMAPTDLGDRRLPDAPSRVFDGTSEPQFGTYAGALDSTRLDAGVDRLTRLRQEKRWQWFLVGDAAVVVGGAVVDLGVVAQEFAWVLDRESGDLVVDETRHRPGFLASISPRTTGGVARTRGLRERFAIERSTAESTLAGTVCGVAIDLEFDTSGTTDVTAICPVNGGVVNATRKGVTDSISGSIDWGAGSHDFGAGIGLFDATHGVLAPATSWRWGIGYGRDDDGRPVGFNVVSGFNDGRENVVWLDGQPHGVGPATLTVDEDAVSARTSDGLLDAELSVEGSREETTTIPGIGSEYRQPVGTWHGTIAGRSFVGVLGVAEDHTVRW
jgi:hypothetical protein